MDDVDFPKTSVWNGCDGAGVHLLGGPKSWRGLGSQISIGFAGPRGCLESLGAEFFFWSQLC